MQSVIEKYNFILTKYGKNYNQTNIVYDGTYKDNIDVIIRDEIAEVFSHVLENAGVYKRDEQGIAAFDRFIASL